MVAAAVVVATNTGTAADPMKWGEKLGAIALLVAFVGQTLWMIMADDPSVRASAVALISQGDCDAEHYAGLGDCPTAPSPRRAGIIGAGLRQHAEGE